MDPNAPQSIPYIAHEAAMDRAERTQRRLWFTVWLLIFAVAALVATNIYWIWYESQFETISTCVEQENDGGYNNYIGNDGDIVNGQTEDYHNSPTP